MENGANVDDGRVRPAEEHRRCRARSRRCSRGRWRSTSSGSGGSCRTTRCILNCKPPGGPRQFQLPYGVQFVEDRERQRIFVLIGSGNSNYRIIYTDGRGQKGQVGGDDDNPLYYGRVGGQVGRRHAGRRHDGASTRTSGSPTAGCRIPSSFS